MLNEVLTQFFHRYNDHIINNYIRSIWSGPYIHTCNLCLQACRPAFVAKACNSIITQWSYIVHTAGLLIQLHTYYYPTSSHHYIHTSKMLHLHSSTHAIKCIEYRVLLLCIHKYEAQVTDVRDRPYHECIRYVIQWKIHLLDFSTCCKDVEMTSKNLTLLNNARHLLSKVRFLTSFQCIFDKQKNQAMEIYHACFEGSVENDGSVYFKRLSGWAVKIFHRLKYTDHI